ncbi:hypothetical protein Tsubulata_011434 [Turnera subulata]|uniref:Protein BCCIP homolog n=1 Tax=Turnera subulata TaxID=218843 RepID=A0A9Q0JFK2_9ROSI|nr:hypothetical protein Tsubulata_011434 [Turnera subulata]
MTRRPRRLTLAARPVTFSRFARSVANLAAAYLNNHRPRRPPPQTVAPPPGEPARKTTAGAKRKELDSPTMEKAEAEVSRKKKAEKAKGKRHANHSSSSSDEEEEEEIQDVVQVDFVFNDPKPDDFHGIKMLMQTYLDNEKWDLSGFVDLILGQPTVGTVVKQEDDDGVDDDVFSVVSALNLGRYKDHKCVTQLKEFVLKVCKDKTVLDDLRMLLGKQAHSVGLLISQRVSNLPPQLLPHLYDGLFDEISWAAEDEPTEELRNSFRFESYLLVTKVYERKNVDQKTRKGSHDEEERIYVKLEDEIFHQLCSWSFIFPLRGEQVTPNELKNYRLMGLVMSLKAEKVPEVRRKLHSSIDES